MRVASSSGASSYPSYSISPVPRNGGTSYLLDAKIPTERASPPVKLAHLRVGDLHFNLGDATMILPTSSSILSTQRHQSVPFNSPASCASWPVHLHVHVCIYGSDCIASRSGQQVNVIPEWAPYSSPHRPWWMDNNNSFPIGHHLDQSSTALNSRMT